MIPEDLILLAVKNPTVEIPGDTYKFVTEAIPEITLVAVLAKEIVFVISLPLPIAVYISEKFSLIFNAATNRVSPFPSFGVVPVDIPCLDIR
jgi:ABC-type proline/glycine betaine transport system permease subunit